MPYADPRKQREAQRLWAREKYRKDIDFQVQEANRKAEWLQVKGKPLNAETSKRWRASRRRAKRAAKSAA